MSQTLKKSDDESRPTLSSQVHEQLRADIMSGDLAPGQRLPLDMLKARYKVGATPLREALYRLSSSLLVELEDQRGFRVTGIGLRQFEQVIEAREHIETLLLRESIKNGDVDWEGRLLSAHNALRKQPMYAGSDPTASAAWQQAHRRFHYELLSASKHFFLDHFYDLLWPHARRYRNILRPPPLSEEVLRKDHQQILEAAMERDLELATLMLRRHIQHAAAPIMQALEDSEGVASASRKKGPRLA